MRYNLLDVLYGMLGGGWLYAGIATGSNALLIAGIAFCISAVIPRGKS